jgi:hypothetical protein
MSGEQEDPWEYPPGTSFWVRTRALRLVALGFFILAVGLALAGAWGWL